MGRPAGSLNKMTAERMEAAQAAARPPVPRIDCRLDRGDVRMWDYRQNEVGQFGVVSIEEANKMKELIEKADFSFEFVVHHVNCDGDKQDGTDEPCQCPRLERGEKFAH